MFQFYMGCFTFHETNQGRKMASGMSNIYKLRFFRDRATRNAAIHPKGYLPILMDRSSHQIMMEFNLNVLLNILLPFSFFTVDAFFIPLEYRMLLTLPHKTINLKRKFR